MAQPQHLAALSVGDAVPQEGFSAVVHSVFHSALNLRLQNGNSLLTLVVADEADLPQGIRVDTPADFSFEQFKTGELVSCDMDFIHFTSLTVDLRGAPRWTCNLPALNADISNPAVLQAWQVVWQALNERQRTAHADIVVRDLLLVNSGASTGINRRAGNAMRELLTAVRRCDSTDMETPLRSLIGLGSGLTPSGDDLLVGFCAGLWCAVRKLPERSRFMDAFGKEVLRLSSRTNEISRTYLIHAPRGEVSSRLADLAGSICNADQPGRLLVRFESAVQVGHSSGMDAVTGLLLGLAAWSDDTRFLSW